MSDEAYKKLIEHHKSWLFGFPDSEYLLPLLKSRFSAEDAEFFCQIPFVGHTIEQLSKKLNISEDKLKIKLDEYAKKGLIQQTIGRSTIRYNLSEAVMLFYRMPGWLGRDNDVISVEDMEKISSLSNLYYEDVFAKHWLKPHRGLRSIPINQTVKDSKNILPYEDVLKYVDNAEFFAVSHCACRMRHNLDKGTKNCKHETLNCLHFDRLGRYTVDYGFGIEISKERSLEILKQSADKGLVHGISNSQEGIDTICNCCDDCCLYLEKAAKMHGMEYWGHQKSNYIREIDAKKCEMCGLCVKRCPMDALSINEKNILFKEEQCIGCGVCVHKCPTDAIFLVQRKKPVSVPKDGTEFAIRYLIGQGKNPEESFKKNMIV